jgi:hypothetical protein
MKWIYTDYRVSPPVTLFECEADDILTADHLLELMYGIDAKKQPLITVKSPDWWQI